jgi:uncharacterized membrane protein YbhN (UPF0104 family)
MGRVAMPRSAALLKRTARAAIVVAAVAALVLVVRHIGAATIAGMIGQVGWAFCLVTLIYAAHTFLRGVSLWQTLPWGAIPLRRVITIRFGAEGLEMLTLTGPFVAEPAKAWLLQRGGLDGPEAVGAVAAEYLLYNLTAAWRAAASLSVLLLRGALPGALRFPAEGMLCAVAVLTVGCLGAGVTGTGIVAPLVEAVTRGISPRHAVGVTARVRRAEAILVSVLHDRPGRLAAVLAVELAGHGLLALEIKVVLDALGFHAGLATAFIVEGAVKCIGTIFFFVPGQLGVSEGVYAVLLPAVGLPAAAGVTIALVRRARALVVGTIGFALFAQSRRDAIEPF